jgi:hypothetical protein
MGKAKSLDRRKIREYAVAHYGLDAVAIRYDEYFKRLSTLWEDGWYSG